MIWASLDLLLDTHDIEILPKLFADHNPLFWSLKSKKKFSHSCRFNMDLWRDSTFIHQATIDINNFLNNSVKETDPHIGWDASKALFRGFVISYMAWKNKNQKQIFNKIFQDLKILDFKLQQDPLNSYLKESITNLQHQFNTMLSQEIAYKKKMAKQNYSEHATKPGRWLAYNLCKIQADKRIPKLKNPDDTHSLDTDAIKETIIISSIIL